MVAIMEVFRSKRFWVGAVGFGALIFTVATGTEVSETTIASIAGIVCTLIGADTFRTLGQRS